MQLFEIWRQIPNFSNQVSARSKSQYLPYNERKYLAVSFQYFFIAALIQHILITRFVTARVSNFIHDEEMKLMKLRTTFGERNTVQSNSDFINKIEANVLILIRCLIFLEITVVIVENYFGITKTNFVNKTFFLFIYLIFDQSQGAKKINTKIDKNS